MESQALRVQRRRGRLPRGALPACGAAALVWVVPLANRQVACLQCSYSPSPPAVPPAPAGVSEVAHCSLAALWVNALGTTPGQCEDPGSRIVTLCAAPVVLLASQNWNLLKNLLQRWFPGCPEKALAVPASAVLTHCSNMLLTAKSVHASGAAVVAPPRGFHAVPQTKPP